MLHVNLHHFLLTTETLCIDTDMKYRPVFQGEIMIVIISFWMSHLLILKLLEKKKITNNTWNYIMEQMKHL